MKEIFLDIQAVLSTVVGIKQVSEDWGQLNFEQPPVNFPCALIDLGGVEYTSSGRNIQQADAILNITVADIRYNGISANMPKNIQDKAFEIFQIIEDVNKTLHGHGGEIYSRLCRISLKKIPREDAIREFVLSYRFGYTDISAAPVTTKISAKPDIRIQ